MKILLDENLSRKLKNVLGSHRVFMVNDMGWGGKKNGELLAAHNKQLYDTRFAKSLLLCSLHPAWRKKELIIICAKRGGLMRADVSCQLNLE